MKDSSESLPALFSSHSPRVEPDGPLTAPPERWPALFDRALLAWARENRLTYTERSVVQVAVQGLSNKEIGRALGIASSTVGTHLEHVMRKVQVSSRTELAFRFFSEALPPLFGKSEGA